MGPWSLAGFWIGGGRGGEGGVTGLDWPDSGRPQTQGQKDAERGSGDQVRAGYYIIGDFLIIY